MRHGPAGPPSDDPEKERSRPLTKDGEELVAAVAEAMLKAGEEPRVIFASNYERTARTADIVGSVLGAGVDLIDECSPHMPLASFFRFLLDDDDTKRVMIVGHSDNIVPALNELDDNGFDDIAKGEVRRLKIDRKSGEWKEIWRLVPSVLGFKDDYGS
jgi:phosphohistidine phosphatase SixA